MASLTVPSILACCVILQRPDRSVLIVQRPFHKHNGGMWEFPGGKVEPFETPTEAIVREIMEEIGIVLSIHHTEPYTFMAHTFGEFHLNLLVFMCKQWEGEVFLKEDQPNYMWIPPEDLKKYFSPCDLPIFQKLKECV